MGVTEIGEHSKVTVTHVMSPLSVRARISHPSGSLRPLPRFRKSSRQRHPRRISHTVMLPHNSFASPAANVLCAHDPPSTRPRLDLYADPVLSRALATSHHEISSTTLLPIRPPWARVYICLHCGDVLDGLTSPIHTVVDRRSSQTELKRMPEACPRSTISRSCGRSALHALHTHRRRQVGLMQTARSREAGSAGWYRLSWIAIEAVQPLCIRSVHVVVRSMDPSSVPHWDPCGVLSYPILGL
ncbi:hypothetical protein BV25DRAFT_1215667 [Artomyces pyxidatus]|uniref:Uncharacterized protein n=1 Tax=Artomyces pyxidatus TaxID=48021 RepID=A0ACB8SR11_9AGAM|nr:hypothetical protein BV25DRAFT_1215667 [Artomyces pyxidatus]